MISKISCTLYCPGEEEQPIAYYDVTLQRSFHMIIIRIQMTGFGISSIL